MIYKEFENCKIIKVSLRKTELIKENPRIVRDTLFKKIAWDWAKGYFNSMSIVFMAFLKLVKSKLPL